MRTRVVFQEALRGLFTKYAGPCVDWVLEGADGEELVKRPRQTIPHTNLQMIKQLTNLLDAQLGQSGSITDSQVCLPVECLL